MKKTGVLIVGNGFDLAHNLPTKYSDFIASHKDDEDLKNSFWYHYFEKLSNNSKWIDIETEFKNIIDLLVELRSVYPTLNIRDSIPIKYEKILIFLNPQYDFYTTTVKESFAVVNNQEKKRIVRNQRYAIALDYFVIDNFWNFDLIYSTLIEEIDLLNYKLKTYMLENSILKVEDKLESITKLLSGYDDIYALNFNYNKNLKIYDDNISIFNVHGYVDKDIVFGHNNIEAYEFSKYNKQNQRILFDLKKYEVNKFMLNDNNLEFIIMGHSMDKNDHEIILEFLKEIHKVNIKEPEFYGYKVESNLRYCNISFKVFRYDNVQTIEVIHNLRELSLKISYLLKNIGYTNIDKDVFNESTHYNGFDIINYQ